MIFSPPDLKVKPHKRESLGNFFHEDHVTIIVMILKKRVGASGSSAAALLVQINSAPRREDNRVNGNTKRVNSLAFIASLA